MQLITYKTPSLNFKAFFVLISCVKMFLNRKRIALFLKWYWLYRVHLMSITVCVLLKDAYKLCGFTQDLTRGRLLFAIKQNVILKAW